MCETRGRVTAHRNRGPSWAVFKESQIEEDVNMGDKKGKKDRAKEQRQKEAGKLKAEKRKRDRQQPGVSVRPLYTLHRDRALDRVHNCHRRWL